MATRKTTIIDIDNNILKFEGHTFDIYFVEKNNSNWKIFVRGSQIAEYLQYQSSSDAVKNHVDNKNVYNLAYLWYSYPTLRNSIPRNLDLKTRFVNLSGFYNLINNAINKILSIRIKTWLDNEVVPSLNKYNLYIIKSKELNIKNFFDNTLISDFDKKPSVHMASVRVHNGEYTFRYGMSSDIFRQIHYKLKNDFPILQIIFIGKCDNCIKVKNIFKTILKNHNLHRSLMINGKKQTELFTITDEYDHEYFIKLLQTLINNNELPAIKEAKQKIDNLNDILAIYKHNEELRKVNLCYCNR